MKKFTRNAIAAASVALLSIPLSVISQSRLAAASQQDVAQPNIVIVLTDDQDYDSMPVMRNLMARPEGSWVTFTNAYVNLAVCCPSRASLLTGRYAHNHNVISNETCLELNESNTLPVWLDDAGYQTALIGKYLNSPTPEKPPPGWDVFKGSDYKNSEDWLSNKAIDFIDDTTGPFFLYLAYGAPHRNATPPVRYQNADAYVPPDRPNFNEEVFSDKPLNQPKLTASAIAANRAERLNAQRELLAVDDGIQRIVDTLEAKGQLDNTLIIFVPDHGYSWGSHRHVGKLCPYEECAQVPLMIRYPGLSGNRDEAHFVSNVDLAWTIADYAGVTPLVPQDGRSLLPLLDGNATDWADEVLLERHNPKFYGIRTQGWKYVEHLNGAAAGKKELYDLANDPYELENLAGKAPYAATQAEMAQKLQALLAKPPSIPYDVTPTAVPTGTAEATATSTPIATSTATSTPTVGPSPTSTATPLPTNTVTPGPSPTPSATPNVPTGSAALVSLAANGVVAGTTFADEDILKYDLATGQWSMLFDGSLFGLGAADVDAFYDHHGEYLLLSLDAPLRLPNLGAVDDSDIVRFVPDSPGNYATGHFEWYFDGSAAELTTTGEDIDALSLLPDGRLAVSLFADGSRITINGALALPADEDIVVFTGQTGATTSGTWGWYFDGSTIGLTTTAEDVTGVDVSSTEDTIYLSTLGSYKLVNGLAGTRSDIIACQTTPGPGIKLCSNGIVRMLRGSEIGLGTKAVDALQMSEP